jgi:hypothetical protein
LFVAPVTTNTSPCRIYIVDRLAERLYLPAGIHHRVHRQDELHAWRLDRQHPGWKATAGARTVPVSKDGLGLIILSPDRPGDYDVSLVYDGGWEGKLCRAVSAIALLGVAIAVGWRSRRP